MPPCSMKGSITAPSAPCTACSQLRENPANVATSGPIRPIRNQNCWPRLPINFGVGTSPRTQHTAARVETDFDSLIVTHPFHPLAGQRVPIVFERRGRSGGKVYVCDCGGLGHLSLPESFTDRGSPLGTGTLDVTVLAELAAIVSAVSLQESLVRHRGA